MKIDIKKIPPQKKEFKTSLDGLTLEGEFYRDNNLVKIEARLYGQVEVECNKCANTFIREIDDELKLIITNQIYNGFDDEYDVIEIFSQLIDFDDIITSEIESIKLDFDNICESCQMNEI
ncbi:MAG: hypothetical protein GXO40_05520 [Epsilonproteobacteria bacterium]|nr:hypothetical protein [Campylobacterota bacterium]